MPPDAVLDEENQKKNFKAGHAGMHSFNKCMHVLCIMHVQTLQALHSTCINYSKRHYSLATYLCTMKAKFNILEAG